jgi:hypothetical protein
MTISDSLIWFAKRPVAALQLARRPQSSARPPRTEVVS